MHCAPTLLTMTALATGFLTAAFDFTKLTSIASLGDSFRNCIHILNGGRIMMLWGERVEETSDEGFEWIKCDRRKGLAQRPVGGEAVRHQFLDHATRVRMLVRFMYCVMQVVAKEDSKCAFEVYVALD